MNKHTKPWPDGQGATPDVYDELISPAPGLLDSILEPLAKPRRCDRDRTVLPFATVVLTPDGSPIRSVLTGRRIMVTGFYRSRKAGRVLPYEGMNELALLKHCEVDTKVVDFRSQPLRFEFTIDGSKRIYIADCVRLLDDGTVEVLEAKGSLRRLLAPDYARKLDVVRAVCKKLGWRFSALHRRHLFEPPHVFANIDEIQSRSTTWFDQVEALRAIELIEAAGGETTLGRLADALDSGPRGLAIAQAMMVRRVLDIDITSPLSAQSRVTLVTSRSVGKGAGQ